MEEVRQKGSGGARSNVVELANLPAREREPMPTAAEIAEYRAIRPRLLAMLNDWERIKSQHGCPVARQILTD